MAGDNTNAAGDGVKNATKTHAGADDSGLRAEIDKALKDNNVQTAADLSATATRAAQDRGVLPTLALNNDIQTGVFTGADKDQNGNGKDHLSKEELQAYANDTNQDGANRLLAQAMLDRYDSIDKNGDGITRDELRTWANDTKNGKETKVENGVTTTYDTTVEPKRVTETKGPDGVTTHYDYDDKGNIKAVTRSDEYTKTVYTPKYDANGKPTGEYTETNSYRDGANKPWEVDTNGSKTHKGSISTDSTGKLIVKNDDNGTTNWYYPNGDRTVEGKDFTTQYKTDGKGNITSIETQHGTYDDNGRFHAKPGVNETLTKDGDNWIRNGNKDDVVTNVQMHQDGSYSYEKNDHGQKITVNQKADGSRTEETKSLNDKDRIVEYGTDGKVKQITTKFGNSGVSEVLTFDAQGKPQLRLEGVPDDGGQAPQIKDVQYDEKTGAYTYTEGDLMVRQMADGTRMRGPKPADGKVDSFKPTTVEKSTGDVFDFTYDAEGNVESVKQTWPKGDYTQGGKPREPETWTKDPETGMFYRSSDGMPGQDLQVDKDGNFSYTYPDGKGHMIRHTDTPDGRTIDQAVKPPAGDQQFGNRKFHVNEDGSMTYDIESGDTLWSMSMDVLLARGYKAEQITNADILRMINEIAAANGVADPNMIYAGTKGFKIPA